MLLAESMLLPPAKADHEVAARFLRQGGGLHHVFHHGIGLHFVKDDAFHTLPFQQGLHAVQIAETPDGRSANDDQGLGAGEGSRAKLVQTSRAKKIWAGMKN